MMANPDMDLTSSAVTTLNGKLQQFAFDREHPRRRSRGRRPLTFGAG